MTHGSLFSGIGGFDLAAKWMGWENKFHCEWNEFGQKILKHYWPQAETYGDITKTDFTIWRGRIDILTGGFPCQPYSTAGKRLGKEDERHLWPEMLRAIREIQPRYIVGENVSGIVSWNAGMVFDEVQSDLENEGYEVIPFLLPACGVNAPHKRERVWFIAHSNNAGNNTPECGIIGSGAKNSKEWEYAQRELSGQSDTRIIADARLQRQAKRQEPSMGIDELCKKQSFTNTDCGGLEKRLRRILEESEKNSNVDELCYRTNWNNFPTEPPIRCRNDGFPSKLDGLTIPKHRNESIKAYGNAIVPQVAFQIFKAVGLHERLYSCQ